MKIERGREEGKGQGDGAGALSGVVFRGAAETMSLSLFYVEEGCFRELTVGGSSLLPSLLSSNMAPRPWTSIPFLLMISERRSSMMARSRRSLRMFRFSRAMLTRVALLASSTSALRFLRAMHFILYAASTDGASDGGTEPDGTAGRVEPSAEDPPESLMVESVTCECGRH